MSFYTQLKKSSKPQAAIAEIHRVGLALSAGSLAERANLDAATGEAREILIAVNGLLEAGIQPIQKLGAGLKHMSAEHDRGDIDVTLPADDFKGEFAVMAKGVNNLVNAHIAVKKKAMACVKEFGEGNFDASLEQLPGKKAFINQTIDTLRANLRA